MACDWTHRRYVHMARRRRLAVLYSRATGRWHLVPTRPLFATFGRHRVGTGFDWECAMAEDFRTKREAVERRKELKSGIRPADR